MNKKFLQSVAAGIATLALVASCSHFSKKDSNTCGAKNGCGAAVKKDEAHKCSAKKTAKKEAAAPAKEAVKTQKKQKKSEAAKVAKEAAKVEAKTEEKKN